MYAVPIISTIFSLVCIIFACIKLKESANDKGYSLLPGEKVNVSIAVKCFFFGIPYMIAVASLPDKKARESSFAPESTTEQTANIGVGEQKNAVGTIAPNEWQCDKCGAINSVYTGTCSCGARRPIGR